MNVTELYGLAKWYGIYFGEMNRLYSALYTTLQHNSTQPNQLPVEEKLNELVLFLQGMRMQELSLHQMKLLTELDVGDILGPIGAQNVADVVKTASYDPASTATKLNAAVQATNNAQIKLAAYSSAVTGLGIPLQDYEPEEGIFIVRVGFKDNAAIQNIADWKNSADDWFMIIRGLALVAGEAPEDTKIVGVANGSIILVLATTCVVTSLLAKIAKHISGISKEVLGLGVELESLRQKKIMTKTMEAEFTKLQKKARDEGLKAINSELELSIVTNPEINGEAKVALEKSIEKLLKFGELGGDLDFIVPPQEENGVEQTELGSTDTHSDIQQVRQLVEEYQQTREAIRLLEGSTK
jgi:hypothetical protein